VFVIIKSVDCDLVYNMKLPFHKSVNQGRPKTTNAEHSFKTTAAASRDSSVGIATGYGLEGRGVGVRVLVGSRIFSSPRRRDRL
jgi:hypothetical protein